MRRSSTPAVLTALATAGILAATGPQVRVTPTAAAPAPVGSPGPVGSVRPGDQDLLHVRVRHQRPGRPHLGLPAEGLRAAREEGQHRDGPSQARRPCDGSDGAGRRRRRRHGGRVARRTAHSDRRRHVADVLARWHTEDARAGDEAHHARRRGVRPGRRDQRPRRTDRRATRPAGQRHPHSRGRGGRSRAPRSLCSGRLRPALHLRRRRGRAAGGRPARRRRGEVRPELPDAGGRAGARGRPVDRRHGRPRDPEPLHRRRPEGALPRRGRRGLARRRPAGRRGRDRPGSRLGDAREDDGHVAVLPLQPGPVGNRLPVRLRPAGDLGRRGRRDADLPERQPLRHHPGRGAADDRGDAAVVQRAGRLRLQPDQQPPHRQRRRQGGRLRRRPQQRHPVRHRGRHHLDLRHARRRERRPRGGRLRRAEQLRLDDRRHQP